MAGVLSLDLFSETIYRDFWQHYLENETRISVWLTDRHLQILKMNQGALSLRGEASAPLSHLDNWLDADSKQRLWQLSSGEYAQLPLDFVLPRDASFRLYCSVKVSDEQILIIGESHLLTQADYLEQISSLYTELISTSRNLLREKRQLEKLRQESDLLNQELQAHLELKNSELSQTFDLLSQEQLHLKHLTKKADMAQQAKTELIRHISHEFRTPLNSILGYAQILQKERLPQQAFYADEIIKSGQEELRYVENLLALMRLEKEDLPIAPQTLALADWLTAQLHRFSERCRAQNTQFSWQADALPEHCLFNGDLFKPLLERLFEHLLANAKKETITLTLKSHFRQQDFDFLLELSDTGQEIASEEMRLIFASQENVFQPDILHSRSSLLNLVLCRYLASALGGSLDYHYSDQNTLSLALPALKYSGQVLLLAPFPQSDSPVPLLQSQIQTHLRAEALLPLWEKVKDTLIMDELDRFIQALEAQQHSEPQLRAYTQELRQKWTNFELEELSEQLKQFPDLISNLTVSPAPDSVEIQPE